MLIIVAIVLLLVLPGPWNVVGFIAVTFLWFGELYLWSRKVKKRPKRTGVQTLIGKEGVVVTACHPSGQVRVGGELWEARCEAGASEGDAVRVVSLERLTAIVERVQPT